MKLIEKWASTLILLGAILGSYVALKQDIATIKSEQSALVQRLQDTRDEMEQLENRVYRLTEELDGTGHARN